MSWHAAAVHLPIALTLVWPCVDFVGWASRRAAVSSTGLALLLLALVSSLVATATGQAEYDAAFAAGFSVELLDSHASVSSWMPWALLAVTALRIWAPTRFGPKGHLTGILLGVALWGLVIWAGKTGGALVYEHGVGVQLEAATGP